MRVHRFDRARGRALRVLLILVSFAGSLLCARALADDDVKQSCLDAHGQGQDEREQGHITLARGHFTLCAQPICPALVKDDCARLLDEVERAQPSIGFAARDAQGNDLPDTSVFVDGVLLISRLDGIMHDVDPGMHVLRFVHEGSQREQSIIVGTGEKGRVIVEVFGAPPAPQEPRAAAPVRPVGPAIALGVSSALVIAGGTLVAVGLARVPDACSVSKHECAAPPGAAVFDDASRAMRLSNAGWIVGGVGLAALGASLLWYFKAPRAAERMARSGMLAPFANAHGVGLTLSGRL